MRTALAGFLVALVYFVAIGTFLGMAMPSKAHLEAYIDALAVSATPVDVSAAPHVG